jgi:pyruvate/2-oxoglutarate dehydrogenase complex dihydrolipoamide dehydrogenase (E3) component
VVLGGGAIGSELAQAFARFGSRVTQVEMLPRILPREDPEISEMVTQRFRAEGIDVRVERRAKEFRRENGKKILIVEHDGEESRIEFDEVLVAVGRAARTQGYGLEELGIGLTPQRTIEVNEYLQTIYPNIYCCGDVAGPYQFTHMAAHQAWFAAVNALFGSFKKFKVDYSVVPWATFTDPEVARVGLNEEDAKAQGISYEVTRYPIAELDRAITDEEAHGVVKGLTVAGIGKILGGTIVGEHAGDMIGIVSGLTRFSARFTSTRRSPRPTSTPPASGRRRTPRRPCCAGSSAITPGAVRAKLTERYRPVQKISIHGRA